MKTAILIKALCEPMRYSIFQQLLVRKHCVRSLSKKMGITESAISQHMKGTERNASCWCTVRNTATIRTIFPVRRLWIV